MSMMISFEQNSSKVSEYHEKMSIPALSILHEIEIASEKMHRNVHGYALHHEHALSEYLQNKETIFKLIDEYETLTNAENSFGETLAPKMMQNMMIGYATDMKNTLEKYDENFELLMQSIDSGAKTDKIFLALDENIDEFRNILAADIKMELDGAASEQNKISQNKDFSNLIQMILIFSGLGFSIIIPIYNYNWFKHRIKKIKSNLELIQQGKFTQIPSTKNEKNELNEIELKTVEVGEQLRDYQKKLLSDEKIKSIGQLSANMAHDMRNPLSVISNAVEIINQTRDDESFEKELPRMRRALDRMTHQIDEVLEFVRVDVIETQTIPFQKIIKSAISSIQIPQNISLEISQNDVILDVDYRKIEVVLVNLIHNSIMAIGENSGKISIDLTDNDEHVKITVTDSANTLSEENSTKIFEPLFTTKQHGTGLGLSSCQKIIEAHHGKIWAETNPTRIIFTLPKS